MAEAAGYGGSITYTNLTAGVKQWSLNWTVDPLETTDFGDSGNKTYIRGLKGWTATVTANWDAANTADPDDSATLTLTAASGKTYAGTALLIGVGPVVEVAGVNQCTYTFQGTGALVATL